MTFVDSMHKSWLEWRLVDSLGISDRGTKAKSITSCDNAFVTNIVLARDSGASNASEAAHRTPPGKRPVGTDG